MKSTEETYHTLSEFRDIHAKLGKMFKADGITEEDRMKLAGQLTISSQIKELTDKVAFLRDEIVQVEGAIQVGVNEYMNK
tara:strand:+ start:827 stop:1066 length:240 start_codon:yes stop_codon:yes gene_type:complete